MPWRRPGNVLGGLTLFGIGWLIGRGGRLAERLERRYADQPERLAQARERLERWGPPALVLAWVPFAGDVLVLAAGVVRLPLLSSTLWMTLGKGARYVVWAMLHGWVMG